MTFHVFGAVLTGQGAAANNRGETKGTIAQLQKLKINNRVYTTVSSEAIRYSIRQQFQELGFPVNRKSVEDLKIGSINVLQSEVLGLTEMFDPVQFIDDDVMGFMKAEAAKKEDSAENLNLDPDEIDVEEEQKEKKDKDKKKSNKNKPKGSAKAKRGILEVSRAISTTPFGGNVTFNSVSGEKNSNSIYGAEVDVCRYQYGFGMTPTKLKQVDRVFPVIDAIVALNAVAGNHGRYLYDFSPESIILRWTHDFAPRLLNSFQEVSVGSGTGGAGVGEGSPTITISKLVSKCSSGDVDPTEIWVGGEIANTEEGEILTSLGANVFPGVKKAATSLKERIARDLKVSIPSLEV